MATELSKATQLGWRKWLLTDAGKEGMLFLREKTPSISKGDADSMIFDGGKVEGYKMAVDTISEIIAIRAAKEEDPTNY